jgi:hypothetical protein
MIACKANLRGIRRQLALCVSMIGASMEERPGVVERAFQIAKSGTAADVADLCGQLKADGYANAEQLLAGRSLNIQVTRMIVEARHSPALPPEE